MANTFTTPGALPDRAQGVAGEHLTAGLRQRLGDSQNWAHAAGSCGNMLSQLWAPAACDHNTVLVEDVCVWRVPQPAHLASVNMTVQARLSNTTGADPSATVKLRTPGITAPDSISMAITGAALEWHDQPLDCGTEGTGYVDIHMDLAAFNAKVEVRGVSGAYVALTSPLAAGPSATDFVPWGEDAAGVDRSAPSADGHQLVRNEGLLLDYQRTFMCWSAVRGTAGGNPETVMPAYPHRSVVMPTPGSIRDSKTAKVWVRVLADQVADGFAVIHAGPLDSAITAAGIRWGDSVATIEVEAIDEADPADRIVWLSAEFDVPERWWLRALPWPSVAVGLFPSGALPFTTADVISCTIEAT